MDIFGPLMLAAAEAGDIKRLISTLEYVQNIDFKDDQKQTALHKAAGNGHEDIVQLLLEKGASIKAKDTNNFTPLHLAAQKHHASTVNLLLEKGTSIAWHMAATEGTSLVLVVNLLLERLGL